MDKSVVTNLLALACALLGYGFAQPIIFSIGLFALSGAITNWLAIHMLFEKVPGLYGSGVIPSKFKEFKIGIRELMMNQFFTEENIDRFLSDNKGKAMSINLAPVIDKIDLSPAFDSLIEVIQSSSFGSMLAMVGGAEVLQPLREPFIDRMKTTMIDISQSDKFTNDLRDSLEQPSVVAGMQEKVSDIVEQRLEELTPELVKDIIQAMIKEHLGWLVVWGGVFGGVIGLVAAVLQTL